jgi:hypothetical protein
VAAGVWTNKAHSAQQRPARTGRLPLTHGSLLKLINTVHALGRSMTSSLQTL